MPHILLASKGGWPSTLFMWLVRGITAFATLYWFFLLLAMTPFFLLFVVPALGFSFLGGRDGPKIAAVLLTAGCFLATLFYFIIKG